MNKYAYVTILYGNNIYLTGALVMGFSLMKTNSKCDRIIMITPDTSAEYQVLLKSIYTHIINIDYVAVNKQIFAKDDTRFSQVFTKLACLSLIQYDKIILLDLDMIICKNMDHLFELKPPAACVKHHYVPYGKVVPKQMICDSSKRKLVGSINAGLMLLKPDLGEWKQIQTDILSNIQINKYKYPEQDYLSLRYCGQWTSITFNYNFQFGLTRRVRKMRYNINDIYVIHYSSKYKPWNLLLTNREISEDEAVFIDHHQKYYDLWLGSYQRLKKKYQKEDITLPY